MRSERNAYAHPRPGIVEVGMSLVGNLEDLSLGDILQIISLSQKTGVLALQSPTQGAGRVVFRSGLVSAASLVGRPAPAADEAARQDEVESVVLHMFTWPEGDFSFDVRHEPDPEDPDFQLEAGLNAQYLAMEGMRVRDEIARAAAASAEPGEDASTVSEPAGEVQEDPFADWDFADDEEEESAVDAAAPSPGPAGEANRTAAPAESPVPPAEKEAPPAVAGPLRSRPLVLIDADSVFVGWAKNALGSAFSQVHVFQQAEQGLARIRQYLIRGQFPIVLLSSQIEVDPLSGIQGVSDFVKRLKTQAPRLPIYCLLEEPEDGSPAPGIPGTAFDGGLARPGRARLQEWAARDQAGQPAEFVRALLVQLDRRSE